MQSTSTYPTYFQLIAWLLLLAWPVAGRAQVACALVPVPLAERVQHATLLVEGRVTSQQVARQPDGHLVTRSELAVFKVFRGVLPAGPVRVLTPGGVLGTAAEVVSGALALQVGQQGIFLLAADRRYPAELQAYAGPQGFIRYDLATLTATEPFARYPSISTSLYPALTSLLGNSFQAVQPNADLAAAQARALAPAARRPASAPIVSSYAPAAVTAGTSTDNTTSADGILTINGAGFLATRGTGGVVFQSADFLYEQAHPAPSDYLLWTDTQIRVRVPGAYGNAAGSGPAYVQTSDGSSASLGPSLTVTYSVLNVGGCGINLVSPTPGRGYVMHYAPDVPVAARAPFAAALATWHCQAGTNLEVGGPATQGNQVLLNGESTLCFGEIPAGSLALAYSYYTSCQVNKETRWDVQEIDYLFNNQVDWSYDPAAVPGPAQYDFLGVLLHELGHGAQLGHLVSGTGVMNAFFYYGQPRRSLDVGSDLAGAAFVSAHSVQAAQPPCFGAPYVPSYAGCPRFIDLLTLTARYAPGQGTTLAWTTASEQQAAYFAVESLEAAAVAWQEITRQPAAGTSTTPRTYSAFDARPLTRGRYYRLRQIALDGTLAYSRPVLVQGAPATAFVAYPNPAAQLVHLSGPLAPGTGFPVQVQLLDALGRSVCRVYIPPGEGEVDLPLTSLAAGLYVLEWHNGDAPQRLRLVVE